VTADLPPTGLLLWRPIQPSATPRLVAVAADRRAAVLLGTTEQVARDALGEPWLRVVRP
jgi:hypothetical protein